MTLCRRYVILVNQCCQSSLHVRQYTPAIINGRNWYTESYKTFRIPALMSNRTIRIDVHRTREGGGITMRGHDALREVYESSQSREQ